MAVCLLSPLPPLSPRVVKKNEPRTPHSQLFSLFLRSALRLAVRATKRSLCTGPARGRKESAEAAGECATRSSGEASQFPSGRDGECQCRKFDDSSGGAPKPHGPVLRGSVPFAAKSCCCCCCCRCCRCRCRCRCCFRPRRRPRPLFFFLRRFFGSSRLPRSCSLQMFFFFLIARTAFLNAWLRRCQPMRKVIFTLSPARRPMIRNLSEG